MTPYLTNPNPELASLTRQTPKGMMYWSGTCSDPEATCGSCKYYGDGCELYLRRMGRTYRLDRSTRACKYFEKKQRR